MIQRAMMVVEDERVVALHLKQQLTRLGYECASDRDLGREGAARRSRICCPTSC